MPQSRAQRLRVLFGKGILRHGAKKGKNGKPKVIYSKKGEKFQQGRGDRLRAAASKLDKFGEGKLMTAVRLSTGNGRYDAKFAASARREAGIKPKDVPRYSALLNRTGGVRVTADRARSRARKLKETKPVEGGASIRKRLKKRDTPDLFGNRPMQTKARVNADRIRKSLNNPEITPNARRRARQFLRAYDSLS